MMERPRLDPVLQDRLEETETLLQALYGGEVDAVVSDTAVWLLRAQQAESALRASEARFRDLVGIAQRQRGITHQIGTHALYFGAEIAGQGTPSIRWYCHAL